MFYFAHDTPRHTCVMHEVYGAIICDWHMLYSDANMVRIVKSVLYPGALCAHAETHVVVVDAEVDAAVT